MKNCALYFIYHYFHYNRYLCRLAFLAIKSNLKIKLYYIEGIGKMHNIENKSIGEGWIVGEGGGGRRLKTGKNNERRKNILYNIQIFNLNFLCLKNSKKTKIRENSICKV